MANIRVKDLPNILPTMGAMDVIPVEDVTNNETKKITIEGIKNSIGKGTSEKDGLLPKEIAAYFDETGKHLPPFGTPRNSFIIPALYNMVSFDPATFTFTWTNDIYIVNGRGGYGTLKAGSVQLEANAMTAFINMSDIGTGSVGVVTVQKAAFSVSTEIGNEGNYFLAARVGDVVSGTLWDLVGIIT
jgi:hypothetical protein